MVLRRKPGRPKHKILLGAHMSVAGGLPLAVDRAIAHRCDAFQIFSKNANQWRGRLVPPGRGSRSSDPGWRPAGSDPLCRTPVTSSIWRPLTNCCGINPSQRWLMKSIGPRRLVYWAWSCIPAATRAEIARVVSNSSLQALDSLLAERPRGQTDGAARADRRPGNLPRIDI